MTVERINGVFNNQKVELVPIDLPGARTVRGKTYPIGFNIKAEGDDFSSVVEFFRNLGTSGTISKLLNDHGLVILQGLGFTSPKKYSQIVEAIFSTDYELFDQVGLLATREEVEDGVSTVGAQEDAKKHLGKLNAHQEFSRYLHYPAVLTFFSKRAPTLGGGESTTTHATELLDKVYEQFPEVVQTLFEKGATLSQTWGLESPKISWTHPLAFGRYLETGDSLEVQKQKAIKLANERVSNDVEFVDDNLVVHQNNKVVLQHPFNHNPIIFSSLPTYYAGYYNAKKSNLQPNGPGVVFGDGTPIPEDFLDYLFEQSIELEYTHKFVDGDLILLDNYSVYHGRNPYVAGDREILASFWDKKDIVHPGVPESLPELFSEHI
ncbi:hypothetical protein PSN45_002654 [Yamadazyma tenuis]|uniref:Clavaminate synthase-like protein n=1 Tax=Candida tenuis (strain ATCC 10573 / BCRC 21748 / CBS 615 / JCM 9827 / NBRC 10315 / NRRL Y-1498 / VKM Y-70) TaxID=590646 RepID=G3AX94_CANTC|nr:Clavaminate synthase-like protein [Yamadazyma tenuis ATCC 10573]EGV66722.1 Clavaminate synthase-like protein [Yamadazyma tenuis ATCC 10573]WEJ95142.1 hypothetical protein PSN45_002654 [Yamadazyma tenuis]